MRCSNKSAFRSFFLTYRNLWTSFQMGFSTQIYGCEVFCRKKMFFCACLDFDSATQHIFRPHYQTLVLLSFLWPRLALLLRNTNMNVISMFIYLWSPLKLAGRHARVCSGHIFSNQYNWRCTYYLEGDKYAINFTSF